jgi:hypothetical protein
MEWCEPVLLRYDFEVGPTISPATVCVGFPQRVEDQRWTCAYQFRGVGSADDDQLQDGHVYRLMGHSGLEALIEASNAIRARFEALADVRSRVPCEFIFPRFLPTSSWFDLYDWAKELVTANTERRERPASPSVEQLSHSSWDDPTLLEQQFKFAGGRKVTVRLGFPTFSQLLKCWICAVQIKGVEGNQIKKVSGDNGLLAVANATDLVRASLDQIGALLTDKNNPELTFPANVPIEYGLELHRQLCEWISAEIKNIEAEDDKEAEDRANDFDEMLAWLAPSARL